VISEIRLSYEIDANHNETYLSGVPKEPLSYFYYQRYILKHQENTLFNIFLNKYFFCAKEKNQ